MPYQALWPKEVRPVKPTSRLRPSAAIARQTICEAVFVDRPSACTAKGSSASATAPTRSGRCLGLLRRPIMRGRSFELLDALAEQPARAEHEDEEHQHVHRGFARGGREVDG